MKLHNIHPATERDVGYVSAPADEIAHVQDYQDGWNDAQSRRPFRESATIYYSTGYVDGARADGALQ